MMASPRKAFAILVILSASIVVITINSNSTLWSVNRHSMDLSNKVGVRISSPTDSISRYESNNSLSSGSTAKPESTKESHKLNRHESDSSLSSSSTANPESTKEPQKLNRFESNNSQSSGSTAKPESTKEPHKLNRLESDSSLSSGSTAKPESTKEPQKLNRFESNNSQSSGSTAKPESTKEPHKLNRLESDSSLSSGSTTTPESTKEPHKLNTEPMVLSLHYWEQVGNALKSLLTLQCWSKSVNISSVVEPLIFSGTTDILGFYQEGHGTVQKFGDLLDSEYWDTRSSEANVSRLVSTENFLLHATRNLVYVQILYGHAKWDKGCKSIQMLRKEIWFKYLVSYGFRISTVCIRNIPMSKETFQKKIFTAVPDGNNITIVFGEWRGLSLTKKFRLHIRGSRCTSYYSRLFLRKSPSRITYPQFSTSVLLPAKRVLDVVDEFISRYLSGTHYIGVMLRFEKFYPALHFATPSNSSCVAAILSDYKEASNRINTTKTLLLTDYGTHGSSSIKEGGKFADEVLRHIAEFVHYFEGQFDLVLSPEEINNVLESITGSRDSILIALLQSQLVARASCVVMAGMGAFQMETLDAYLYSHKGKECYYTQSAECVRGYADYFIP